MNLAQLVALNTLVQITTKAVTLTFGITTTALLTNYLGPAGFGDYIFALSFVAIFSGMADWGTMLIAVKEASREEKKQGQIFGNVLLLRLGLSLLVMFFSWVIIFFFPLASAQPEGLRRVTVLASTLIAIFSLKASLGIIFQTKLKMERFALVDLVASLATLVFSFLAIKTAGQLSSFLVAIILANILAIIIAFFLARPLINLDFALSLPTLGRILKGALPMGGTLLLFSVYNRADALILQALKGSSAVGVYGVSYRVYEVLVLGAFYLMNTLLPVISPLAAKSGDPLALAKLKMIYQKTFDILLLAGGLVLVGVAILAPLAIKLITWQRFAEFASSVPLLRILALAATVSYFNHLTGYTIVALGQQWRYFLISLAALLFNLSLNLVLIPAFSFFGAAWVTFLTEALVFFLTSLFLARILGFWPKFFNFPKTALEVVRKKGKIF